MSQNPLAYSGSQPSQPSKPSPLKPQLASALASLEVQLEQELTRYRRSRPTGVRAPLFGSNPSQFPINNPAVTPNYPTNEPATNQTQISDSSSSDSSLSEPNSFTVAARTSNTAPSEIETSSKLPPTEIPGMSLPTPPPPPGMAIKSNVENLENLETEKSENYQLSANQNPSQETSQGIFLSEDNFNIDENLDENISTENTPEPPTANTNQTQASIIPSATATSSSPQTTARNANFGVPPTGEPDDYLESSEALLRSLAEEDTSTDRRDRRNNNSLLSPLGIGSMLLLLIASAVLGIVLFQPKLIPQGIFGGSSQRNANSDTTNSGTTNSGTTNTNTGTNSQKVAEPQLTPVPQYPNLANDEFPEVKSPNDVVGLTPKPTINPQPPANVPANPSAIAPVPGSNVGVPTNQLPPANPLPVNPAPPAAVQPNIQPSIQPNIQTNIQTNIPTQPNQPANPPAQKPAPVSDADLKPSASGMYQFVVPNQGDTAFANTRKIVPDAYVSPDKKYIHIGAVSSKERAKKLLAELRAKGLNPQPYQP